MPKRRLQKCSLCRVPGHTKRTCKQTQQSADVVVTKKKKKPKSHVFVAVDHSASASPHKVDLQKQDHSRVWKNVPVYTSDEAKKQERVVLDLSGIIKKHNTTQEQKDISLFRQAMKKHVKKELTTQARKALVKKVHTKKRQPTFSSAQKVQFMPKISISPFETLKQLGIHLRLLFSGRGLAYAVIGMLLVASLPIPALGYYNKLKKTNAFLVQESTNGFMALQASTVAALQSNIDQAGLDLNTALTSFSNARSVIEKDYHLLLSVAKLLPIVGDQVKSRQHLLLSGQHLALGNTYLIRGIEQIRDDEELVFTSKLGLLRTHIRSAAPQYQQALSELQQVNIHAIPAEHQKAFQEFRLLFATFVEDMNDLVDLIDGMQLVLGEEGFKRYLIVFQNHHELRPTGGFAGSYALLDVQKGKILNIDIPAGGSYDLQGQLSEYVQPPVPLQLVNGRWEFQDSNWFPDFGASAEKMAWFYEHAREETVDGVIAVNASVLERFLRVLGPVVDPEHQLLIADYDALDKIQEVVEEGEEKEAGTPKAILSRILDQLMNRLPELEKVDMVALLSELHQAAQEKEIQIFTRNNKTQNIFRDFGWTGEIHKTQEQQDYLMVVNTNIQGQKSDARVEQDIVHHAAVQADGSVIDSVTIRRKHTGHAGEEHYGARNISYMRVYVPQGAELLEAKGFVYPPEDAFHVPEDWYAEDLDLLRTEGNERFHIESGTRVTDEFGKTAFGNWVMTSPGDTSEVTVIYRLPYRVVSEKNYKKNTEKWKEIFTQEYFIERSSYSLLAQKQSGVESEFSSTVTYPESWVPVWRSDDRIDFSLSGASYADTLDRDQLIGVILERSTK